MVDQQRMGVALGSAGEAVMALYALTRLLRSRDLGPSHLTPALDAVHAGAAKLGTELADLFALLGDAAGGHERIADALRLIEPHAMALAERVGTSLGQAASPRLGAKQRLQIERAAEELGRELEGVRVLLGLCVAALHAQPVDLLLANVLDGSPAGMPTFVAQRVEVRIDPPDERAVHGDPRVLWPLLEAAFRELAMPGGQLRLTAAAAEGAATVLRVEQAPPAAGAAHPNGTIQVSLSPQAPMERDVVTRIAEHLGVGYEVDRDGRAVTIRLC
jgi:hypothetical protein